MAVEIHWFGHASFRITGRGMTVYIDPWKLPTGSGPADVVVVSHGHYDHCSPEDVEAIRTDTTMVLAPSDCVEKLGGGVTVVEPGQTHMIEGLALPSEQGEQRVLVESMVEIVPAYNVGKEFHPRESGGIGVVVRLGSQSVYYAGDTDVIPEMDALRNIDVALLPVGGTYTMDAFEATRAAKILKPGAAIPYHWGDIVGDRSDAERFKGAADCHVNVLSPGTGLKLTSAPDGKAPSEN